MGEEADYLIDQMIGDLENNVYYEHIPKTCKYCGETDLWWIMTDQGWRLHDDDGNLHNCNKEDKDLENDLIAKLKRRVDGT